LADGTPVVLFGYELVVLLNGYAVAALQGVAPFVFGVSPFLVAFWVDLVFVPVVVL
jgi:hypothetical protein